MRKLWYVPLAHTSAESFATREAAQSSCRIRRAVERSDSRLDRAWKSFAKRLDALIVRGEIRPERLLVFCDGMPHPLEAFPVYLDPDRFRGKSPTHEMLMFLRRRGARLCGTENPAFLAAYGWYQIVRSDIPKFRNPQLQADLIAVRDLWIAQHIAKTLPQGRDAILFIGALHRVDRYLRFLAPDIRIRYIRTIYPGRRPR